VEFPIRASAIAAGPHIVETDSCIHAPTTKRPRENLFLLSNEVLGCEIATDRRMMSDACPKYSLAAEVRDVAAAVIIRAAQMLPKLFFAEVAQDGNFLARIGSRDIGQLVQRKPKNAHACPTPTRAGKYLALCDCRLSKRNKDGTIVTLTRGVAPRVPCHGR
jgi:hypothetical protein